MYTFSSTPQEIQNYEQTEVEERLQRHKRLLELDEIQLTAREERVLRRMIKAYLYLVQDVSLYYNLYNIIYFKRKNVLKNARTR
jgi:hypothetical protein